MELRLIDSFQNETLYGRLDPRGPPLSLDTGRRLAGHSRPLSLMLEKQKLRMHLDRHPLPKLQTTLLALRAHTALAEILKGSAAQAEWTCMAEVLNTVNALACLKSAFRSVRTGDLLLLYVALRETAEGAFQVDPSVAPLLTELVYAYDRGLQSLARKTIAEATLFIDRCTHEQSSMDLDVWLANSSFPPMIVLAGDLPARVPVAL